MSRVSEFVKLFLLSSQNAIRAAVTFRMMIAAGVSHGERWWDAFDWCVRWFLVRFPLLLITHRRRRLATISFSATGFRLQTKDIFILLTTFDVITIRCHQPLLHAAMPDFDILVIPPRRERLKEALHSIMNARTSRAKFVYIAAWQVPRLLMQNATDSDGISNIIIQMSYVGKFRSL